MSEHGISTISEIYDGDPPHSPQGTISQAWSVAEVLRVIDILETKFANQ
jgi:glycogen debranching enzyme